MKYVTIPLYVLIFLLIANFSVDLARKVRGAPPLDPIKIEWSAKGNGNGGVLPSLSEVEAAQNEGAWQRVPERTLALPDTTAPEIKVKIDTKEMDELLFLRAEVERLRTLTHQLECLMSVGGGGPISRWVELLPKESRPDRRTLISMSLYLHDYPVELRYEEGLWIIERIEKDDWAQWSSDGTVDTAIFTYLGEARLKRELTPEQFDRAKP